MELVELAPESVEAIARRVAELLATERRHLEREGDPVPLLPIVAPRKPGPESRGRRRDDLANGLQGTPFRRSR